MPVDASVHLSRAWRRALGEHDVSVAAFISIVRGIPEDRWSLSPGPRKWSPAEEVLHVALAYEVAVRGVQTGAGMQPRVSPARARLLRWLVLPVMLGSNWFPRASAPREIRPPKAGTGNDVDLTRDALLGRVEQRAREVRDLLPSSPPGLRFHHAYFGDLPPRQAMRMLAAHTRHHTRALGRRFLNVME